MASSYHSKVRSTQNRESYFPFVWDIDFSITSPCFGGAKVSTVNTDLTNFVNVQCLHENIT